MIFFLTIPSYKISCYLFNRYMYQRIKHARIQNWKGGGRLRGIIFVCFVLFVCLGFFFLCLFLGFFFWIEEIRLIQGMGSGSFGSALPSPFLDPRMTSVNIYPNMYPDAMHHEATGFLLAWSKSPFGFPNKRITVPCIRKKLNIHCPVVFLVDVRCDRILSKCQPYLFLIPSIYISILNFYRPNLFASRSIAYNLK